MQVPAEMQIDLSAAEHNTRVDLSHLTRWSRPVDLFKMIQVIPSALLQAQMKCKKPHFVSAKFCQCGTGRALSACVNFMVPPDLPCARTIFVRAPGSEY
eukprot:442397-Rhodomonas_salina.1